jgi:hypothetical protein
MASLAAKWVEFKARRALSALQDQVGAAGLLAAAAAPGIGAGIDQHAAAVRDIMAVGVEESAAAAGVVLLAGYARGLLEQAKEMGWQLTVPTNPTAWATADWLTCRLVGVCALASRIDDPGYRLDDPGYRLDDPGYRLDDPGYRLDHNDPMSPEAENE